MRPGYIRLPTYANGGPAATATPAPAETAPPAESEPTVEPERLSRDSELGQKLIEVGREEAAKQLTQDALDILSTINVYEIMCKVFDNKDLVLTNLPKFDDPAWTAVENALTEKVNDQLKARKQNVSQATVRITRGNMGYGITVAQWQVTVMIPTSAGNLFKLTDLQAKTDTKQEEIMGQHIEATGTAHVQWTYWGSSDDWKRLIPVGEITTKVELIGQSPDFNTLAVVQ